MVVISLRRTLVLVAVLLLPPAVAIAVSAWWLVGPPREILTDTDFRMAVITPVVRPSGELVVRLHACKVLPLLGHWSRSLIDGVEWNLAEAQTVLPLGCADQFLAQTIPSVLPPGHYRLSIWVRYDVNPLRHETYRFLSDDFEVRPHD